MTIQKSTLLYAAALLTMAPTTTSAQNGCYYQFCPIAGPCRQVCPPIPVKPTWNYGPPEPYRQINPEWNARQIEALRAIELLPPEEFDHEYTGILKIIRGPQSVVRAACPEIKPERPAIACAVRYLDGDTCTVYIANDTTLAANGWTYEMVLRHERSHCNGWRHSEKFR